MSPATCTRESTRTIRKSQARSTSETRWDDSTTLSCMLRDCLHQVLEELSAGEWVERRHGFVEQQQLGSLGDSERERELGALSTGEPAGALVGIESEPGHPGGGQVGIPPGVEVRAEAQVVRHAEAGVRGRVLADVPDLLPWRGPAGRRLAEHLDRSRSRRDHPDRQVEEGALAGAVGADQADDAAGGDFEGAVGERPLASVLLAQSPGLQDGVHAVSRLIEERNVDRKSASMLSSSSPARRARASHCSRL